MHRTITMHVRPRQTDEQTDRETERERQSHRQTNIMAISRQFVLTNASRANESEVLPLQEVV